MRIPPRNLRIIGASLIAVLMVVGGYVLPGLTFPETKAVNAELTDDLLASYISKDTDGDGLPDWQESLYGTDANTADTDGDGISDGEAVRRGLLTPTNLASEIPTDPIGDEDIPGEDPAEGSLTEEFSRAFFQAYVQASNGQPLAAEAQQALITRLLGDFSTRAGRLVNSSYTTVSVRTNAAISTRDYTASVEDAIRRNDINLEGRTPSELMQAAVEDGDEAARLKLVSLANAEAATARELLAIQVPPALAQQHLQLLRSTDSLAKATRLVSGYKTDPVATMGALIAYAPASQEFVNAIKAVASAVLAEGEPLPGAPGAYLIEIARSVEGL